MNELSSIISYDVIFCLLLIPSGVQYLTVPSREKKFIILDVKFMRDHYKSRLSRTFPYYLALQNLLSYINRTFYCYFYNGNLGCKTSKGRIQIQLVRFLPKTMYVFDENYCILWICSAKLSKSNKIFYVKNHLNLSDLVFHWKISI